MVGIKDIAKAAGVSISTVSYALNGSPRVSEATRLRIQKIADDLQYVPNMAARNLKRQKANIIGVYLANYGGFFYGELLEGIKRGLAQYDYELIVCSGEKSHIFLPERMIDGAIVLDYGFRTEEIVKYGDRGFPIVVLDRQVESENVKQVLLDNRGGATLATERLLRHHPDHVYVIKGPKKAFDSNERCLAAENELTLFNTAYTLIQGDFTQRSGFEAAKKIHQQAKDGRPIYIFSLNDEMALGVYKYFKEEKLIIGQEVLIVGFDNIEIGSFLNPTLATIGYSQHRWGILAAQKIIKLVNKEAVQSELIYTEYLSGETLPEKVT